MRDILEAKTPTPMHGSIITANSRSGTLMNEGPGGICPEPVRRHRALITVMGSPVAR